MISEKMGFRGHDDVCHVFLEVITERTELGVILWQSRCEEGQKGGSWIHVDLTGTLGGERGDIGTV